MMKVKQKPRGNVPLDTKNDFFISIHLISVIKYLNFFYFAKELIIMAILQINVLFVGVPLK